MPPFCKVPVKTQYTLISYTLRQELISTTYHEYQRNKSITTEHNYNKASPQRQSTQKYSSGISSPGRSAHFISNHASHESQRIHMESLSPYTMPHFGHSASLSLVVSSASVWLLEDTLTLLTHFRSFVWPFPLFFSAAFCCRSSLLFSHSSFLYSLSILLASFSSCLRHLSFDLSSSS